MTKLSILKVLFFCMGLSGIIRLSAQNPIPNPYFETWDARTIENPVFWKCTGNFSKQSGSGQTATLRLVNNAVSGIISYAEQVKYDSNASFAPAFSINGTPDSIRIIYKPMLGNDTASILLSFIQSGDSIPVIFEEFQIHGNNNGFITATFPLSYIHTETGIEADSGFISIASADVVDGPLSNGYLEIASIEFLKGPNSMSAIPNGDFSDWTSYTFDFPVGWTNSLALVAESGISMNHSAKSTDSRSGSSAIKIQAFTVNSGPLTDTIPGFAVTVKSSELADLMSPDIENPAFSMGGNLKPLSIRGFIKTALYSGDIFRLYINFYHTDSLVGSSVITIDTNYSDFAEFSGDISWLPGHIAKPEFATIGLMVTDTSENMVNDLRSYAIVDDLFFDNWPAGRIKIQKGKSLQVYPNPAAEYTLVSGDFKSGTTFELLSAEGRNINKLRAAEAGKLNIDLNGMPNGFYILKQTETSQTIKFLLQR
jgi:hypothetical protein